MGPFKTGSGGKGNRDEWETKTIPKQTLHCILLCIDIPHATRVEFTCFWYLARYTPFQFHPLSLPSPLHPLPFFRLCSVQGHIVVPFLNSAFRKRERISSWLDREGSRRLRRRLCLCFCFCQRCSSFINPSCLLPSPSFLPEWMTVAQGKNRA